MKSQFTSFAKDNIATAAVLAATFVAIVGVIADSTDAFTDQVAAQMPMQRLETISVVAARDEVIRLETILVTASRETGTTVASN